MRAEVAEKERPLLRQLVRTAGAPAVSLFMYNNYVLHITIIKLIKFKQILSDYCI